MEQGDTTEKTGNADAPEPKQPFCPEITGKLRERITQYAIAKGRSRTNAVHWLLGLQLTKEGF